MAVTTVDSGTKALEFLGFHEDDQSSPNTPPVFPNNHQVWFILVPFSLSLSLCLRFPTLLFFSCMSEFPCFFVFFQEVEVNLIITDYCMPGMTGYDLLRKIKVFFGFYCFVFFLFHHDIPTLFFLNLFPLISFFLSQNICPCPNFLKFPILVLVSPLVQRKSLGEYFPNHFWSKQIRSKMFERFFFDFTSHVSFLCHPSQCLCGCAYFSIRRTYPPKKFTGFSLIFQESSSLRNIPVVIMSSENEPSRINR